MWTGAKQAAGYAAGRGIFANLDNPGKDVKDQLMRDALLTGRDAGQALPVGAALGAGGFGLSKLVGKIVDKMSPNTSIGLPKDQAARDTQVQHAADEAKDASSIYQPITRPPIPAQLTSSRWRRCWHRVSATRLSRSGRRSPTMTPIKASMASVLDPEAAHKVVSKVVNSRSKNQVKRAY
jgi:hypothetical protein